MKKSGKISISLLVSSVVLEMNNFAYAATSTTEESAFPVKYIFLGIAFLVIILLLFLGYRMDSKGDSPIIKPKKTKIEKKPSPKEETYEADDISYESDNINTADLVDKSEYEEDNDIYENNLVSDFSDDDNTLNTDFDNIDSSINDSKLYNNLSVEDDEEVNSTNTLEDTNPEEELGEDFDTSIIDNIEDEDEIEIPKKVSDETMVFNNFTGTNDLENEIDSLDDMDSIDDNEVSNLEEEDNNVAINEINSFKEPETTFEGFSVASDESEKNKVEPKKKKYTKVKKLTKKETKGTDEVTETNKDVFSNEDFLKEMENNLLKNQEKRKSNKKKTE